MQFTVIIIVKGCWSLPALGDTARIVRKHRHIIASVGGEKEGVCSSGPGSFNVLKKKLISGITLSGRMESSFPV
jgi:hypothetical protein